MRLGHHRALDAAARHRAQEIALVVDHQIGADRPRRRAPGLDHGGERHAAACLAPVLGRLQDVFVARERLHASPSSSPPGRNRSQICYSMDRRCAAWHLTRPSSARPWSPSPLPTAPGTDPSSHSRLWIGRNSSTCGSIALMPLALASKPSNRNSGLSQISRRHDRCSRSISKPSVVVGVALQPVGDQQHDRALRQHAARPLLVEGVQRGGDAGAAGPVGHWRDAGRQRFVRIALA